MTNKLFTKATMKRNQLFGFLINKMTEAGWERLNPNYATAPSGNKTETFIMHSMGKDGASPMYVELSPFAGSTAYTLAASSQGQYDIRTTNYVNPVIRFLKSYNPATNEKVPINGVDTNANTWMQFCFLRALNYSYDTSSSSYQIQMDGSYDVDFYYYVDKDIVMTLVVPFDYTDESACFSWFGLPEENFLVEKRNGFCRDAMYGSSGKALPTNTVWTCGKPAALPEVDAYQNDVFARLDVPLNPSVDGLFQFTNHYMTHKDYGVRCRLDGFYNMKQPSGGILSGDTIEVEEEGQVQKYLYFALASGPQNYSTFNDTNVVIRVA